MFRTLLSLRRWEFIVTLGIFVLLMITTYFSFAAQTRAASEQPLAFTHRVMVQFGINCLFCHTEATRSMAAGMPSEQKCMGCHNVIATKNPEIQKLAGYWQRQEPIKWVRVNELPRFVYFSHQVHVAAGFNCERCHGDVSKMSIATPVVKMDMGWCLSCHEKQPNKAQLMDCVVCHQ